MCDLLDATTTNQVVGGLNFWTAWAAAGGEVGRCVKGCRQEGVGRSGARNLCPSLCR